MYAYFSESAPSRLNPTAGSTTRFNRRALIHLSGISAQLVKLMGPVMFLRPALTALLHTAILSPPPEKRALVLQHCLHKVPAMSSIHIYSVLRMSVIATAQLCMISKYWGVPPPQKKKKMRGAGNCLRWLATYRDSM